MSDAAGHIAALDEALADDAEGEDIILRRVVGATNQVKVDVKCRAGVRSPTSQELVAGITQDDLFCTLSPTQINAAQWPGGQPPSVTDDPRVPSKNRGDMAFVRKRWRAVQWAQSFHSHDELVRIDMRVLG